MSNRSISQPVARTYSVVDLVEAAIEGRMRIPDFQRPLRWQWEDVRRLFDSIVKGYPIGNFLLWKRQAPEAEIKLGGIKFKARHFDEGWWVVDGQQRLTSMANALTTEGTQDERFSLSYDLKSEKFVRPPKIEDGFIIPLSTLFDLQRLISWFTKSHPEASEKLDEASKVTRAIREYQVPAYLVDQDDEAILRDIFDRMNNYGKRLSRAEVFSALHPGLGSGMEPSSPFQKIAESINSERGFGVIDDDTIMRAILARRGGNVSRDIRAEFSENTKESRDFGFEKPEMAYQEGEYALLRAVSFLQDDAGIPHFLFLPYRYLLVVLTRFFSHFPDPQPRNRHLLKRWFWRAAMVGPGPFSSSWTNAMSALAARIYPEDENGTIQRLLEDPINKKPNAPKLTGFRTNSAEGRIILSALWDLNPNSIQTGEKYDRYQLSQAIELHETLPEIFPRILSREPDNYGGWAANRIFILDADELPSTVTDLLVAPQIDRFIDEKKLFDSHGLNEELIAALASGDKVKFLKDRQILLNKVVNDFIKLMTESDLEDTPPLESFDLDDMEIERDDFYD